MTLVIDDFQPVKGQGECIVSLFSLNKKYICFIKPYLIEIFVPLQRKLSRVLKFETNSEILAASHILPPGCDNEWILLINESQKFITLCPQFDSDTPIVTVIDDISLRDNITSNTSEFAVIPELIPLIEVSPSQRFIAIHITKCFVLIFELRPSKSQLFRKASINIKPKQIQKNEQVSSLRAYKVYEDPYVVTIGPMPILFMKLLHTSENLEGVEITWMAVVVRDMNLRYILKWYMITKVGDLKVDFFKNMSPMDVKPHLMVQIYDNMVAVLCDNREYLYPEPDFRLTSEMEGKESIKWYRNYASMDLSLKEGFSPSCFLTLNKKEILICATNGSIYMLNVKEKKTMKTPTDTNISTRLKHTLSSPGSFANFHKIGNLSIREWNTRLVGHRKVGFDFLTKLDEEYVLGSTYSSIIGIFKPTNLTGSFKLLSWDKLLPVTFLSLHNRERIMYAKGNFFGSEMSYEDRKLEIPGAIIKMVKLLDTTDLGLLFIVLTESYENSDDDIGQTQIQDRILIYDSNFVKLSSYHFKQSSSCFDILPLEGFACTLSKDIESSANLISNLKDQMSNSFLTVYNYTDDSNVEKTELLLFHINDGGELKLTTLATVNREANFLLRLNERKCALFGPHCLFWIGIVAYNDPIGIKLTLSGKSLGLPCTYITDAFNLDENGKEIFVADAFDGLYYVKLLDSEDGIDSVVHLLSGIQITCIDRIGTDGLVVGDFLGNIRLFAINKQRKLSCLCEFNLHSGSIGCITTIQARSILEALSSQICYPLFIVGTNQGCLIKVYGVGTGDACLAALKYEVFLGNHNCTTLDRGKQSSITTKIDDSYRNCTSLLSRIQPRILPGSGRMRVHHTFDSANSQEMILDLRYVKAKCKMYGLDIPEQVKGFMKTIKGMVN